MSRRKTVAVINVIVNDESAAINELNETLHEYRSDIIGRMGLPYPEGEMSIISVAVAAKRGTIEELTKKLQALQGFCVKASYPLDADPEPTDVKRAPSADSESTLKALRTQLGLSQREMADKLGATQTQVSAWENGRFHMSQKYLDKLAALQQQA